jgi:hypothetical protein
VVQGGRSNTPNSSHNSCGHSCGFHFREGEYRRHSLIARMSMCSWVSLLPRTPLRNCLKSLASSVTKALEAHEVGTEGLFRCGMPAISTLETPLGDFLDSFSTYSGE